MSLPSLDIPQPQSFSNWESFAEAAVNALRTYDEQVRAYLAGIDTTIGALPGTEAVQDIVGAFVQNGTGLTWTYNDGAGTLTGVVSLAPFNTGNLAEGANLYYTDERVDDRVAGLVQNGTGLTWTYNDGAGTLTGNVSLAGFSTTNLGEGANLYYTDERVDDRVAVLLQSGTGISWTYNDAGGTLTPTVTLAPFSTTNLGEGTNLYFTNERAQDAIGTALTNTATITWTYDDAGNTIKADVPNDAITFAKLLNATVADVVIGSTAAGDFSELSIGAAPSWTPTVTPTFGSFGSPCTVSGKLLKLGKFVFWTASYTINAIGTAAGHVVLSFPYTTTGSGFWFGLGWRGSDQKPVRTCMNWDSGTQISVFFDDGTFPGTTGNTIYLSGWGQIA